MKIPQIFYDIILSPEEINIKPPIKEWDLNSVPKIVVSSNKIVKP